jgi:uncharacterized tellurite resistance protein B-like protein
MDSQLNPPDRQLFYNHLKHLYLVALADGNFSQEEKDYIKLRIQTLGLSEEEMTQILSSSAGVDLTKNYSESDIVAILHDVILIMLIDGQVEPKEYIMVQKLAVALGVKPALVDPLIRDINQMIIADTNYELMIQQALRNLN